MVEYNSKLHICLFIAFIMLGACSSKLDFAIEGPFIVITSIPSVENEYRYFYPRKLAVYDSGKVRLHTEQTEKIIVGDDAPEA